MMTAWIRISNSPPSRSPLPSPREAVGRGQGWGVPQQTRCHRSKLIDPPPPTPPRHAQRRGEGGEITVHTSAISRLDAPELCWKFPCPPTRGRREYRVHAAPAVSCAKRAQEHAHEHTGSAETLRHSLRNGFTAYIALSPEYRAFLPPSPREYGFVRPVGLAKPPRDLTPTAEASGPHDFAVRESTVRLRALGIAHGKPPCNPLAHGRCRVHRNPSQRS